MTKHWGTLAGAGLVGLVFVGAGCSFDDAGFGAKVECVDNADCGEGRVCTADGRCAAYILRPDAGNNTDDDTGHTDPICDGEPNACGGCTTLNAAVGDECGSTCGSGQWKCAGTDALTCDSSSSELNACGACAPLVGAPGDSCGHCGTLACDADGQLECVGDQLPNGCGGCGTLAGDPQSSCGPCLDGVWICNADGSAVVCRDATEDNGCGGCTPFDNRVGAVCDSGCGSGVWECSGADALLCASDDPDLNVCGGCDVLTQQPGDACEGCGTYQCTTSGNLKCVAGVTNVCGGCSVLEGSVGDPCGDCGGRLACAANGTAFECAGEGTLNGCGGCAALAEAPGTACGQCGGGSWVCQGHDAVECVGATTPNSCGGCEVLVAAPGSSCGECGDGVYQCNDAGTVDCVGAVTNACGGCGTLVDSPGSSCGECGATWTCQDGALVCSAGEEINACGGCGALPGTPGQACSCRGAGEAVWTCVGTTLSCLDGNDAPWTAKRLPDVDEDDSIYLTGWIDGPTDADWYLTHVTDKVKVGDYMEPTVHLHRFNDTGEGISYQICEFFQYDRDADIAPYSCGHSDDCVYYDASEDLLQPSNCRRDNAFDSDTDMYGCCETDYGVDSYQSVDYPGWITQIKGVDGVGDQSGWLYILITSVANEMPDHCDDYESLTAF